MKNQNYLCVVPVERIILKEKKTVDEEINETAATVENVEMLKRHHFISLAFPLSGEFELCRAALIDSVANLGRWNGMNRRTWTCGWLFDDNKETGRQAKRIGVCYFTETLDEDATELMLRSCYFVLLSTEELWNYCDSHLNLLAKITELTEQWVKKESDDPDSFREYQAFCENESAFGNPYFFGQNRIRVSLYNNRQAKEKKWGVLLEVRNKRKKMLIFLTFGVNAIKKFVKGREETAKIKESKLVIL